MDDLMNTIMSYAHERPVVSPRLRADTQEISYRVVSVDDHITEPPDLFTGRVSPKYSGAAPHVSRDDGGVDWWVFDHDRVPVLGSDSWQGFEPGHEYLGPVNFDELHPAVYRIEDRVAHLDAAGTEMTLGFPSAPFGFAGTRFIKMHDQDLGLECLRAYNDWYFEEWYSRCPARVIPCQLTWLNDADVAAGEVRRNAARGFKSLSFSENPERLGLPSLYTSYWDPLFSACVETGTVINLHVGSSGTTFVPSQKSAPAVIGALFPINAMAAAADWLFSDVLLRFPDLKLVLSEGGLGWVPILFDRLEIMARQLDYRSQFGECTPYEILQRNFYYAVLYEPRAMAHRDLVGTDHILVEIDYPHPDSIWSDAQALLRHQFSGIPEDDVDKMTHLNAREIYGLEPSRSGAVHTDERGGS